MIGDMLVVDAVIHPYNLAPENQNPAAQAQLETVYAAHRMSIDERNSDYMLSHAEFFSDFPYAAIACAEFVESAVDLAVIHSLPNLGFALGNTTDPDRAAAFRDRYPNRFRMYATVDTPVAATAIAELERQVKDFGVDGLKLYPAFFYGGQGVGWRLDSEDYATPLLVAAQKLGIRHVAIHKALWLPPAPREAFKVDDLATPMARFPDITFEIVHAGTAFLEETCRLLEEHRNLYLNLETTFSYILAKPRVFAKVLGTFLTRCGSDRLMFASGNNLAHPYPILEAFANYELPQEILAEFGFRQLTAVDRRNILGQNALRRLGLDERATLAAITDDEFARARRGPHKRPWSVLREPRRA
jgi:predicted TIM-barrel fold metal-dependent hydrolase